MRVRGLSDVGFIGGRGRSNTEDDGLAGGFNKVEQAVKDGLEIFVFGAVHVFNFMLERQKLFADIGFIDVRGELEGIFFVLDFLPIDVGKPGVVLDFLEITQPQFGVWVQQVDEQLF